MIRILILGGGFGGVRCALDLSKKLKKQTSITLVDRNGYHLFTPALYEVASMCDLKSSEDKDFFAVEKRETICIPFSDIFYSKKETGINFIQAEVGLVDLKLKRVVTKGGEILPYDYLVIALGSQSADFGIYGVREYAHQFKNINDAITINLKIEKFIKQMVSGQKMTPLRILIGGAGFTGIEFAAEIICCVKNILKTNKLRFQNIQVMLIEAGSKILPMISNKERDKISKRLTKLGVILMEGLEIGEVGDNFVKLKNGKTIDGDIVVWTAGVRANEFLKSIEGLPLAVNGKIKVGVNLNVQGLDDVFSVGDDQEFIDPKTQKPVPAFAHTAIEQGKIVAVNIYNLVNSRKLKTYIPHYKSWIAPVGGKFALVHLWNGIGIGGLVGWLIREFVDFKYLVSILGFKKGSSLFLREIKMFIKND